MKNNKFKNIYLTVLSIITIAAILFGCMYHIGHFFRSDNIFTKTVFANNSGDSVSDTLTFDEELKELIIEADISDLSIEYGDKVAVDYNYPGDDAPEINMTNGILNIDYNADGNINMGSDQYQLNITVPKGNPIDHIKLDIDCGNVEIDDIQVTQLDADLDMGNFEIDNANIATINSELDMGNFEATNSEIGKADVDLSMGNLELHGKVRAVTGDVSMGNIEIDSTLAESDMDLDLNCDLGTCTVNGKNY